MRLLRRALRYLVRLGQLTLEQYRANRTSLLAGAIAFYAFLSLFPFLLVAVAILGYVLGSSQNAYDALFRLMQSAFPTAKAEIAKQIGGIIRNRSVAGWLGLAGLVWAASAGFGTLRLSLRTVFQMPPPTRSWLAQLKAMGAVFVTIVFLLASLLLTSAATAVSRYRLLGISLGDVHWLVGLLGIGVSLLVDLGMFSLLYRSVPSRVGTGGLLVGAGFAAVAWELAKLGFAWYVTQVGPFAIYGSLGTVVLLMLWVYYTAVITLLGAELAWAHARVITMPARPSRF